MKGTIVEIQSKKAAMLSVDGNVSIIPNKNYQIGQEITYSKNNVISKKLVSMASIAAALIIFIGLGAYVHMANSAYYYVTIDVNPSIELVLNKFGKVVEVNAYNDDGEEILENLEDELVFSAFNKLGVEEAITIILTQIDELGYFEDEVDVVITTHTADEEYMYGEDSDDYDSEDDTDDDADSDEEEILSTVASVANNIAEKENKEIKLVAESIGTTLVSEARELDVSPGKLLIVQKMMAAADEANADDTDDSSDTADADTTDDIDLETALNMSVKEIMAQTKEYKEQIRAAEKNTGEDTENQEENTVEASNGDTEETTTGKTNYGQSKKTDDATEETTSDESTTEETTTEETTTKKTNNGNSDNAKDNNGQSKKTDAEETSEDETTASDD